MAADLGSSSAICSGRHSWHIGSDSGVASAPMFPAGIWHQADARLSGYQIPSVTSQASGIPLQNCGSHYDFVCLATWPFLWLRSGAAFVNGDITGTKDGPFLLNSNFRRGVGDWLGMYEGASRGPSILLVWAGDMLACGPAVPADSVCEAMWAFETGGLWASPTGVVLWVLPTGVVFWTPTKGVSGWAPPTMVCSKVFNLCS